MAVLNQGILGGGRNKVGPVVMTSWKGRAVIKSMPLSVANPRTTPQVNQRNKFKSASQFASLILGLWIKPLWDRFAGNITGQNAWMKTNTETFSSSGDMNPASLIQSKGKMLPPVINIPVADASSSSVSFSLDFPNDLTWGQAGESGYVLAYNLTQNTVAGGLVTGNPGTDANAIVLTLAMEVDDQIECWSAIKRTDGTQVSPSAYIQVIAVA